MVLSNYNNLIVVQSNTNYSLPLFSIKIYVKGVLILVFNILIRIFTVKLHYIKVRGI